MCDMICSHRMATLFHESTSHALRFWCRCWISYQAVSFYAHGRVRHIWMMLLGKDRP